MELRKDALAAEEKLPEFRYRPGRGLRIRAADRSWSWTFGLTTDVFMYNHPGGNPIITDGSIINGTTTQPRRRRTGMHNGQFFLRRNRPGFELCWDDCFYQMDWVLTAEDPEVTPRDVELHINLDKLNPFLPSVSVGTRIGGSIYLGRSSSSGFKNEHNLLLAGNSTTSTGSSSGVALWWNEIPGPLGMGEFTFMARYLDRGVGITNTDERDGDKKGGNFYLEVNPFSKSKNKWTENLAIAAGLYLQPIGKREQTVAGRDRTNRCEDAAGGLGGSSGNTCTDLHRHDILDDDPQEPNRLRIRVNDRNGRITLFDADEIGSGLHYIVGPSMEWDIGPYHLRAAWMADRWEGKSDELRGVKGNGWEIENGLWLFSPKGFLTGDRNTAGSVQV
ncbi:MAG: hypothetical protein ACREA0_24985, partial [bacterium]